MSAHDNFFGHGHRIHPVTRRPLEQGIGHLSDEAQAMQHIAEIEQEPHGKEVAAAMRREMAATREKARADAALAAIEHHEEI